MAIRTARLIVRRFRSEDWADLLAYLSMPEVYRFEPGEPIEEAEARRLAAERAADPGFQAIELRSTGVMVGHCSFLEADAPELAVRELGFIVNPAYQGHGYAAEAGLALAESALRTGSVHRVVAHCHPDNRASWRTLERIGFTREGWMRQDVFFRRDADGQPVWQDTLVYGLLAADLTRGAAAGA